MEKIRTRSDNHVLKQLGGVSPLSYRGVSTFPSSRSLHVSSAIQPADYPNYCAKSFDCHHYFVSIMWAHSPLKFKLGQGNGWFKPQKRYLQEYLVDYASSDEEEQEEEEEPTLSNRKDNRHIPQPQNQRTSSSLNKEAIHPSSSSESSQLKLPDASALLNSPSVPGLEHFTDHSSRVAAAMAENASRKRDMNLSASAHPRSKIPKGTLPHMKNVPETGSGLLLPPQLAGRSNVVTEDIKKLFVRKASS